MGPPAGAAEPHHLVYAGGVPAGAARGDLARCEGRPWPPPSGARLALVEGGQVTGDEEPDPFDDDNEDFDED